MNASCFSRLQVPSILVFMATLSGASAQIAMSPTSEPDTLREQAPAVPVSRPKRKSRRRLYITLACLLVAGLAGYSYYRGKQVPPTVVTVEPATRRTIIQLVSATGKIQPETEVKISPEVAGEIIELPVVDGQPVKKGDLLIRIKPDNYKAQVAQQEAAIASARAMSLQNKAQLEKAREDLKRYTDLYARKVINDSDMTNYKTQAEMMDASYNASLAQIEQAESMLSQSRDLLDKTSIYSPIDGIISLLSVKLGERVVATGQFAGTEVMRVADVEKMEARVNVNENDVVNVKNNDESNISIDAYPNRTFRATVYQIANTAVTTGENTQEEVTNFEVRLHIKGEGARLRPGMSATADIETATVRDVVAVPIQSVTAAHARRQAQPRRTRQKETRRHHRRKSGRHQQRRTRKKQGSRRARQGRSQKTRQGRLRQNQGRPRPDAHRRNRHRGQHLSRNQARRASRRGNRQRQLPRHQPPARRRHEGDARKSRAVTLPSPNALPP